MTATKTKPWMGDPIKKRTGRGSKIFLDDLNGWNYYKNKPIPRDRPVWVITDYQRRCIVLAGVLVRWSLVDEHFCFWHDSEIEDVFSPPDFPIGFHVEGGPEDE